MTTTIPESNAITMLQVNKNLNAKERGWIRTFTRGADLASAIPMVLPNTLLGYKYYEEMIANSSMFDFRSLSENVSAKVEDPLVEIERKASFLGSKMAIDFRLNEADPYELDRRILSRLRYLPQKITDNIINGSSANKKHFVGAKELVKGDYLIGPQSALDIDASAANFEEFMYLWFWAEELLVRDQNTEIFAVMNLKMWLSIQAGVIKKGAHTLGTDYSNVLQKNIRKLSESNILVTRKNDAGQEILPYTEASDTCSIYFFAVSNARELNPDPQTGEMPNGVFAVSDGRVRLRGQIEGAIDIAYMDFMYTMMFPTGSSVRLNLVK